jgi:hypothetical protein
MNKKPKKVNVNACYFKILKIKTNVLKNLSHQWAFGHYYKMPGA